MPQKTLKSPNNEFIINYADVKQVCICCIPYALLQYLLVNDLQISKYHTAYFFDELMPQAIKHKLPHIFFQNMYPNTLFYKIYRKFIRLYKLLTRYKQYPFLKTATIFAQDCKFYSILIGSREYRFLADAPHFLSTINCETSPSKQFFNKKNHSVIGRIEQALYGTTYLYRYGNNPQCTHLYLTEPTDSPVIQNKIVHIDSFQSLWDKASEEKKKFILYVFDITEEDIQLISQRPIIFFSQPLDTDYNINKDEYLKFLNKILSKYNHSQLLIKLHPRDTFDYQHYFPDIKTFSKPVNVELLTVLGLSFKKAITIFSAAVFNLSENIEVDWFGMSVLKNMIDETKINNSLHPPRSYNQVYLD